MIKVCNSCGEEKGLSEYHKDKRSKDGVCSMCKTCRCARTASWQENQKTTNPLQYTRRRKSNNYKSKYGHTLVELESLANSQGNICPICKTPLTTMFIDHDHITGKVRNVLCHNCNVGLGHFKESVLNLQSAIEYLERHK